MSTGPQDRGTPVKFRDMQEAWDDMLKQLLTQYGPEEFNNDSLALLQNVYYQGALAGNVILHEHLDERIAEWAASGNQATERDVMKGINAFGQGLVSSVKKLWEAWDDAPYQVSKQVDKGNKH